MDDESRLEITEVVCSRGDWVCTLCRSDQDPEEAYDCENTQSCGGVKAPYTLSMKDQRVSCQILNNIYLTSVSFKGQSAFSRQ